MRDVNPAEIEAVLAPEAARWADPDWSLVEAGLAPAPEFPITLLRSWGPWLTDYAAMKSAPVEYAFGALIASASACIGASRKVRAREGWEAYPALWILLVGPPSAHKTPVLSPIATVLKEIERDEGRGFAEIRRTYETDHEAAHQRREAWVKEMKAAVKSQERPPDKPPEADEPEEPRPPRIVVNDATIEAMAPIFRSNPRGVLLLRDELAGFVGNIGKYGGDGDAAFWLERYDGQAFSTDRVKNGNIQADIALMSVVGGIQPQRLEELLLNRTDDGFVARFLLIYPDNVPREWETPIADMTVLKNALSRLRALAPEFTEDRLCPRIVPFTPEAADYFAPWWQDNGAAADASMGFHAGMLGKAGGVILRLAMVLEYLEWSITDNPEPSNIGKDSIACAIGLYEEYLLPSACRVFSGSLREEDEIAGAMLIKQIRHRQETTVNAKSIYQGWSLPGLTSANRVNAALKRLDEGGWVRRASRPSNCKGGRPPNDWDVNPALWETSF